jgi:antibiotic biosynthesis monooxygenase (ABM) superfamily enzyme
MSANSYGLIVEGEYDRAVYEVLIRRLVREDVYINPLVCFGKTNLMKKFPGFLKTFEHILEGRPVDMAIIIRDADGRNPDELKAEMQSKLEGRQDPFRLGVRLFAVRQAMDAWLLSDERALSTVTGKSITKSHNAPEDLLRPKDTFRNLLSQYKANYTAEVCRKIARVVDFEALSNKCPGFRNFVELVDC